MKIGDVVKTKGNDDHPLMTVEAIGKPRDAVDPVASDLPGMPGVAVYHRSPVREPIHCVFFIGKHGPFRCTCERDTLQVVE